jgi:hypothetical protein
MGAGQAAEAQPDFRSARQAGPLLVYSDDRNPRLYYYAPNELSLGESSPGKPDLHLLQTRYTGTVAGGDQGTAIHRSLLSFRVLLTPVKAQELDHAKRALRSLVGPVELRPLPIRHVEAVLVYTPVGQTDEAKSEILPAGHFQETEEEQDKSVRSGVYWSERLYMLSLDNDTSQIFWSALQKGQVVLIVGYAFLADGIRRDTSVLTLTGPHELTDALRARLEKGSSASQHATTEVVRAGAFAVTVDAGKWPDLFKQIDINDRLPPGYAVLDVYCYDFQQREARLYEKRVEIEAEGVGGDPVGISTRFRRNQPDIYARSLRFPFAVRLDRPYQYRVVSTATDGAVSETPWQVESSWAKILDVTSSRLAGEAALGDQQ